MRRGNTIIGAMNEHLREGQFAMRLHIDSDKEALPKNSHAFLRRESVLREAQPDGYTRQGELDAYRQSIEAIIMESVHERDKEYLLRRMRNVQEQKAVPRRLDRVCSLLVCELFRRRFMDGSGTG